MKIEHTAYQVADPPALARWYVEHLGLTIKRSQDAPPFGYFLADQGDAVMLEFYRQPHLPVPDYRAVDPLILHLAFWADDVPGTRARLLAAGATSEGDVITNDQGDEVAMLRDPWGLPVQLVRREKGYADFMSKLSDPVLPGTAASDYERYLRTDELLALQKPAGEMLHRDELLFQTIHQTAELWLKLAGTELEEATSLIDRDETWPAVRLLRRANQCLDLVASGTMMLEHLAPWDYHDVRRALGHGSGFDSPGFRRAHELSPLLAAAFDRLVARRGLDLARLYRESHAHEDVFQVAERLIDWDQRLISWRTVHLKLVERIIGGHVIGTQGTPVEVLGRRLDVRFFPALWDIRNALTAEAQTSPPEK